MCLLYLTGWLALDAVASVFQSGTGVSLWYPPTGLTFALLLVFGPKLMPVLPLTDLLHGLFVTDPRVGWFEAAFRSVVTTAVYAGTAWVLLRRIGIDPRLPSLRDVTWFLSLACLAAPLLVAVLQVVQYNAAGVLRWGDLPVDVFGFWSGSATGIGVLAPALLVAARRVPRLWPGRPPLDPGRAPRTAGQRAELAAQLVLLSGTVYLAFGPPAGGRLDLASLVYAPLLWIAVRGGFPRVVAAVLLTNVMAAGLVAGAVRDDPIRLQLGLMTMTLAGLALGAFAAQRRADIDAAQHAAVHDPLTGLANRVLLADRTVAAVHRHDRDRRAAPALLYCDLDGFKSINDGLGHDAGDGLLRAVARRLEEAVRPADTVCRLGGDEFVVLVEGVDSEQVLDIADRAVGALRRAHRVAGREVVLNASIGVAVLDDAGSGPADAGQRAQAMLKAADDALQHAKQCGGDQVQRFSPPLRDQARSRLELHAALRRAVESGNIALAYQPVFDATTGLVVAVEALARWHDPVLGRVDPSVFVAAAEQTGLVHELGRHVLEMACRQLADWKAAGATGLRVAVNLSVRQLVADDIAAKVLSTVRRHDLSPRDLELEITESSATDRGGPGRASLQALSAAGVHLAVDDFGTGWSSFDSLRELAPDHLKIDRSFVGRLGTDDASTAVVRAILAMAGPLGMSVTAEGVETVDQLRILRELGCPRVQGYLLGRPGTAAQVLRLLGQDRPLGEAGDDGVRTPSAPA